MRTPIDWNAVGRMEDGRQALEDARDRFTHCPKCGDDLVPIQREGQQVTVCAGTQDGSCTYQRPNP